MWVYQALTGAGLIARKRRRAPHRRPTVPVQDRQIQKPAATDCAWLPVVPAIFRPMPMPAWCGSRANDQILKRRAQRSIAQDGTRASEVIQHIRAPPFRPDGNRDGRLRREHSRPWCTQTPPVAGTLKRPSVLLGAKTINPSLFQAPPKPSSASQPAGLHRLSGPVRPKNSFSLASRPRKRR